MEKEWGDERGDLCRWALAVKSKGIFNPPVDHDEQKKTNLWIVHMHVNWRSKLSLAQCPDDDSSHKGTAYENKGGLG